MRLNPTTTSALQALRQRLPQMLDALNIEPAVSLKQWMHALDIKLLPRLQPDFPLVVAICGGGSAGKSSLFNSLMGQSVSPTGGRAGLNRRVLAALHKDHLHKQDFLAALDHAFEGSLQPFSDTAQLTAPGHPLYWHSAEAMDNVVLLDTPDIDTGARGEYTNRELARQSLESADAFIYVFTNATYNNRDNTDFIAQMLTGMGTRPCYLIYRVYPSFTEDEVKAHARTVARNIYGDGFDAHLLGIFRSDEDNAVAAGQQMMTLRAVAPDHRDLGTALAALDAVQIREGLLHSVAVDVVQQARQMGQQIIEAQTRLERYLDALEAAQRQSVQMALSHFPTDRVLRRFADIWLASDPTHIKVMRRTGQIVEWPLRVLWKTARHIHTSTKQIPPPIKEADMGRQLEIDLLNAANQLYQKTLDGRLKIGHHVVETHPVVRPAQERLRQKEWKTALAYIQEQKAMILSWSERLETELKSQAETLRNRMGLLDQIRQTFAALLNVIPATAAITYILHTGDPVGAAGIKVKLTGLFGLKDLYALIAIPATAGMKRADQQQLEQMLGPVARTWLQHKLQAVHNLFEQQITGEVLHSGRIAQHRVAGLLEDVAQALERCKETLK